MSPEASPSHIEATTMRAEDLTISGLASWYFGAHEIWPEVYPLEALARYWTYTEAILDEADTNRYQLRVGYLRASLMKLLYKAAANCQRCPLYVNRYPGRTVLHDGAISSDPFYQFDEELTVMGPLFAEIMIVGEGPGNFEARTGIPFVSFCILAGSPCATQCTNYEVCYNSKSPFPQAECNFVELTDLEAPARRAKETFKIGTVSRILDQALLGADLWREGWNGRLRLYKETNDRTRPRPGTVYISNAVKCHSKDQEGKDIAPSAESIQTCRTFLEQQIYIIQPKVIVALGSTAIRALLDIPKPKVISMRGNVYQGIDGLPVVTEVHPSWIAHQGPPSEKEHIERMIASFEIAKQIAAGTYELPWVKEHQTKSTETKDSVNPFDDPTCAEFGPTFPVPQ